MIFNGWITFDDEWLFHIGAIEKVRSFYCPLDLSLLKHEQMT